MSQRPAPPALRPRSARRAGSRARGGREHFHRHLSIELRLTGPIDFAHPPLPIQSAISYGPRRCPDLRLERSPSPSLMPCSTMPSSLVVSLRSGVDFAGGQRGAGEQPVLALVAAVPHGALRFYPRDWCGASSATEDCR